MHKKDLITDKQQLIKTLLYANNTRNSDSPITISVVGAGGKTHVCYWLANFFKSLGHKVCITTTTKMYLPADSEVDNILALNSGCDSGIDKPDIDIPGIDKKNIENLSFQLFGSNNTKLCPSISFLYQHKLPTTQANNTQKLNNQELKQELKQKEKVKGLSPQTISNIRDSGVFNLIIIESDGANHLPIKAPAAHEPCISQCSDIVIAVTGAEAIFSQAQSKKIHRWSEFSSLTQCDESMIIDQIILKRLIQSPQGMFKNAPEHATKIWVINKCDLTSDMDALILLAQDILTEEPMLASVWLTQLNEATVIHELLCK